MSIQSIAKEISQYLLGEYDGKQSIPSVFCGNKPPSICLEEYIVRLMTYSNVMLEHREESFVIYCARVAKYYIDQLGLKISSNSVHRLFTTAFLLAIKILDDECISLTYWGAVSGCSMKAVAEMELAFCEQLEWNFHYDVVTQRTPMESQKIPSY